ncbi:MAG: serine hydrolase domain-containing protein [Verrucomicrobiota bacterium]
MKRMNCPGAVFGVVEADSQAEVFALGKAGVEEGDPDIKVDMQMRFGSVSKLFIGTVMLKLAEEGFLNLEQPISEFVSNVPKGDQITLLDLGRHRSGLPGAIRNPDFREAINAEPSRVWKAEEILGYAFAQESYFEPGSDYRYSNTNTILLALAAEHSTGESINTLLERYILNPLESTGIKMADEAVLPGPKSRAYRYARKNSRISYGRTFTDVSDMNPSWSHAAGSLYGSAEALLKVAGPLARGDLLNDASRAILHDWEHSDHDSYGFQIERWDSFVGHRGDVPGYQAALAHQPSTGRTFFVLTNLSNTKSGDGPANELLDILATY